MKPREGVEVVLYSFFKSALDEGRVVNATAQPLYLREMGTTLPILVDARRDPVPVCTGAGTLTPKATQSPDHLDCSINNVYLL